MIYLCDNGCRKDFGWKTPPRVCEAHMRPWVYEKQLGRSKFQNVERSKKRSSGLKSGHGFAASKKQREKVRGLPCANCGQDPYFVNHQAEVHCDPAHVWARSKGGCDSPECVIPLCRRCHRDFDENRLELLPALVSRGYWAEMAHPIRHHQVSPNELVNRLTTQSPASIGEG